MPLKFIANQQARPHGILGTLVCHLMNSENAEINALAVETLEIGASDRVLEVGFGGGVSLPALLQNASFVSGLDRSADVVKLALSHYWRAVEEDRAEFQVGSVEAIPYESGYFNKVCTVHSIYFWKGLAKAFSEVFRVLAPGGRLAVGFYSNKQLERRNWPMELIHAYTSEKIARVLARTGFNGIHSSLRTSSRAWNVIVAEK